MTIKIQRLVNIAMVLLAWASLPFLGSRNIKRFLPASLLILLFEGINEMIGKRRNWWYFYNKPKSHLFGEFPFNVGPFFVSSLWILKWTFGNFKKFILLNAILNATFAFPIVIFLRKIKYGTLDRINGFQFFLYFFIRHFYCIGSNIFLKKIISSKGNF